VSNIITVDSYAALLLLRVWSWHWIYGKTDKLSYRETDRLSYSVYHMTG